MFNCFFSKLSVTNIVKQIGVKCLKRCVFYNTNFRMCLKGIVSFCMRIATKKKAVLNCFFLSYKSSGRLISLYAFFLGFNFDIKTTLNFSPSDV